MALQPHLQPRQDRLPFAIRTILFTVLALSLGDAMVKLSGGALGLAQIFVLRSAIVAPVLLVLLWRRGERMPLADPFVTLRSLMLVVMWVLYYLSLPHLPLAAAAAVYYTLPIFITLFSALFLGSRISRRGWLAVLGGFAGVALILRPQPDDLNLWALLPLAAAMLYAGAMILTGTRCRAVPPLALALHLNLGFILGGLLLLAGPEAPAGAWQAMGGAELRLLAIMAGAILIGSIGAAIAYTNGPAAVIGSFDFAYVAFAVLWGLIFFGERPDALALAGIALVTGSGILALRS
ncbi:DMT family transporter [Pseudoroseicyclus sp. CXY001]|uniref:DMT family transporter n=1 Tax=Pseudoroseicyclus sp. CXY001 TaxID=3242492 RepID=UPI003570E298